jgi:hypothetical protein
MALPVAPGLVEEAAGLTFLLFNMPDQPTLDAYVGRFVARADAWMQGHMGSNYNLTSPAWAATLQEEGQIYLTLEKLSGALRSLKVQGTHFPYVQEDSPAFQSLIETDWGQLAMASLDLWVTVETINRNFARPLFLTSQAIPLNSADDNGLDPLTVQYERELAEARGLGISDVGTIRR